MTFKIVSFTSLFSFFSYSLCCEYIGPNDPQPLGGLVWQNCTEPNEVYSCGSECQNTCETLGRDCPANIRCNDACYCCLGFVRDCRGRCIPEKDCPSREKGSCP